jgi:hypothetical protein
LIARPHMNRASFATVSDEPRHTRQKGSRSIEGHSLNFFTPSKDGNAKALRATHRRR